MLLNGCRASPGQRPHHISRHSGDGRKILRSRGQLQQCSALSVTYKSLQVSIAPLKGTNERLKISNSKGGRLIGKKVRLFLVWQQLEHWDCLLASSTEMDGRKKPCPCVNMAADIVKLMWTSIAIP